MGGGQDKTAKSAVIMTFNGIMMMEVLHCHDREKG
jgi:hypothetical protein